MTYTPSITTDQVFAGLAAWLADALGLVVGVTVIRELDNEVGPPAEPFVLMTHKALKRLSGNVVTYQNEPAASPAVETSTTTKPTDFPIQVDCYGVSSGDWANVVATMWQSGRAVGFLKSYGITPLYAEDPIELSIVNGEANFEERWVTVLHMQFNPAMVAPMTFLTIPKPTLLDILTKP